MAISEVQFGQFGDHRDEPSNHPSFSQHLYQPEGSKNRFELTQSSGNVTAQRLGKPDSILPGGRPAKQKAGGLHTWKGGTGSQEKYGEGHREVMNVGVRKGFQGQGLAQAMLKVSDDYHTSQGQSLSHSASLSRGDDGIAEGPGRDGLTFANRNPSAGDKPHTNQAQFKGLGVPDGVTNAASTMLGGGSYATSV